MQGRPDGDPVLGVCACDVWTLSYGDVGTAAGISAPRGRHRRWSAAVPERVRARGGAARAGGLAGGA